MPTRRHDVDLARRVAIAAADLAQREPAHAIFNEHVPVADTVAARLLVLAGRRDWPSTVEIRP